MDGEAVRRVTIRVEREGWLDQVVFFYCDGDTKEFQSFYVALSALWDVSQVGLGERMRAWGLDKPDGSVVE